MPRTVGTEQDKPADAAARDSAPPGGWPIEPSTGFLRRVLRSTLLFGALCVLMVAAYRGWRPAGAVGLGLAISVVNLRLLEEIFRQLLPPARHSRKILALALGLKLPLLIGGTALALGPWHLPPVWYAVGFSIVLVVFVFKVVSAQLFRSNRLRAGEPLSASSKSARNSRPGAVILVPVLASLTAAASAVLGIRAAWAETEGEGGGVPELPNLFGLLHEGFREARWAAVLYAWQYTIIATFILLLVCVGAYRVYRRRSMIPGRAQNVVELMVEGFSNFILGIMGPQGREFIPFLGTLFIYIWFNNLFGLLPLGMSPTSKFTTTVSLALCVFFYVQYTGLTKLGIKGYLHHMLGSPRDATGWAMVPLMLPLHLIEELVKPLTLSLRLFGNVLGEDALLGVFAMLGVLTMSLFTKPILHINSPIGIPWHLPFIFLALLLSTIQALVFTLLSSIYFLQMLPHEEHAEHGAAGEGHGH